ncbi:TetR/AcrR family transcriptional regulator [Peptococcaceae bacterium 1198_IL3148]
MDTKTKITQAFRELAYERGFYNATVDELAKRNNISKRTIYKHFNSKEQLIGTVIQQFIAETEAQVDLRLNSADNPIEKITALARLVPERLTLLNPLMLRDLQIHYPQIWDQVEQFRAEKLKHIVNILMQGSQQGYFKEINPVIVTASLLATVRAVINPIFILENNLTMDQAFNAVFDTFLYGIVKNNQ